MPWPQLGPRVPRRPNPIARWIGRGALKALGWELRGEWPDEPKLIVAVAPHSSNMDFILSVAVFWGLNLRTSYLAKRSLFWFPLGAVMRWLGGIPVDRGAPGGLVETLVQAFHESPQLVVGITPPGTRRKAGEWKSGFAQIASAARVPVLPAILNYAERIIYLQPVVAADLSAAEILAATRSAASAGSPRGA